MTNSIIQTVETTTISNAINGRGHHFVKRNSLNRIPKPEATKTYKPVGHLQLINKVEEIVLAERPELEVFTETHQVSTNGQVLESNLVLRNRDEFDNGSLDEVNPTLTIRNSYNKWLPVSIGATGRLLVCLNGMMSQSGFFFARKHTSEIWDDIIGFSMNVADMLPQITDMFNQDRFELKGMEISQNQGYEILGKLYGKGVLTANANNVAFGDWNKPRHEEFKDRNMWSLYNCANEGLKKVENYSRMKAHCELHHYLTTGDFENEGWMPKKIQAPEGFKASGYKDYEVAEA